MIWSAKKPLRSYSPLVVTLMIIMACRPAMAAAMDRIVSLAPNITEIIYDLGLGDQIIAVSTYCNYPPEVKKKRTIGGMTNPSLELIAAMRPSLVVLTDDGNPRQTEERLRNMGINTYVFRARKLQELPREIRLLGQTLGVPKRADERARWIEGQLRRYRGVCAGKTLRKVMFVVQPEPLMVAGPHTAIDDVFKHLGLDNIASGSILSYPLFSLEEVVKQAPHFIFIAEGHGVVAEDNRRLLKKLAPLEAVKQGRIFYLGDPILRLGPRIVTVMGDLTKLLRNYP